MSDAKPIPKTPPGKPGPRPKKPGLLDDPVIRVMVYISLAIVVVFLVVIISVLVSGVTRPTSPRSLAEKELAVASARLTPETKGEGWVPYIEAQVAAGDTTKARIALRQARASVTGTMSVSGLDLAEARIERVAGNEEKAVALADKAMKGYKAKQDAAIAQGGQAAVDAQSRGLGPNYYDSALVKAYALTKLERWKEAVAMFDIYIRVNPTASDILIDRGNAKASSNDKAGAEKDFRQALRFVPYDEEAKAGLKRIGVAQ